MSELGEIRRDIDKVSRKLDKLIERDFKPDAITTELECTGIDQYAIEIEHAGRRIRYEAPSVDGVRELMIAHE